MPVLTQPKPPVAGERALAPLVVSRSSSDRLRNNMVHAERMVQIVNRTITVGASNRAEDWKKSGAELLITAVSERLSGRTWRRLNGTAGHTTKLQVLRDQADQAIRSGCGNCGEQAAIGFVELYDAGVRPINYMELAAGGDHAFLIIGIVPNDNGLGSWPANWGPDAVVCDPWARAAYPASEIRARRGGGETYSSFLRASPGG